MKKIIFLSVLIAITTAAFAQHALITNTIPRFGITPNNDNTGRALTWGYNPFKSPAATDSIKVLTTFYKNYFQETDTLKGGISVVIDTLHQYVPATAYRSAYFIPYQNVNVGDEITFQFTSGKNTNTVTFGFGFKPVSSTLSVTDLQTATISFIFDSAGYWRELSRAVE